MLVIMTPYCLRFVSQSNDAFDSGVIEIPNNISDLNLRFYMSLSVIFVQMYLNVKFGIISELIMKL